HIPRPVLRYAASRFICMGYQMKPSLIPFAAVLAAALADSVSADQTAIAFDATKLWGISGGVGVFGWQLTTHSGFLVSARGIYYRAGFAFAGDGLLEPPAIAIWDASAPSNPLVSGIIPDNASAPLLNGFRYVSTPLVTLPAGPSYVIGALSPHI